MIRQGGRHLGTMKVTRFFIIQKTTDGFDALPVQPASTPSTPRRPRHYDNLHMSLEIPPEIALAIQISLTLTPQSTPVSARASRNNTPRTLGRSPTRAPPIPAPRFRPGSPSQPTKSTSEDLFADVKVETLVVPHTSPQLSSTPPSLPSSLSSSLSSPSSARHNWQRTDAAEQRINIVNNEICDLDPTWPVPIYWDVPGAQNTDGSLPNVPEYPKKYYIIYKGLRPGIYYDIWYVDFTPNGQYVLTCQCMFHRQNLEPLCKRLKGGKGYWAGSRTLREAIISFEKGEKVTIPNIGHFW